MKRVINSLHWCHRMFWYTFAVVAILLAIAISLIRIFITDVKDYRQEIEQFASTILEQEVKINSMNARLSGFTPLIVFNGVKMLDDSGSRELIEFELASLSIDPLRSVSSLKIVPRTVTLHGVSLGIKRKQDGTFQIQGLELEQLGEQFTFKSDRPAMESAQLAEWLFKRSKLAIKNSTVIWQDEVKGNKTIKFENVNFYIRNDGDRHQLTGTVTLPPDLGQDFEIAFDFDGNLLNPTEWRGQFFTKGKALNLQNWDIKPTLLSTELHTGTIDLNIWGEWESGSVEQLTADFNINGFQAKVGAAQQPLIINHFAGLLDWQRKSHGWTVNLNRFTYDGGTGAWPEAKLQLDYEKQADEEYSINAYASYFRLHDARHLLSRSQLLQESVRKLIIDLNPVGEVEDLLIHSTFDQQNPMYSISGKLLNVSTAPLNKFPGIKNFSGVFSANEVAGNAVINSKDSEISIPELFRAPLELTDLSAKVNWWHDDEQWYIQSNDVDLKNDDISGSLSVLCVIPESKASPYLDLQLGFQNGNALSIYKYLPVSIMNKELVAWLDKAFKQGAVTHGGFVFNGRVADFPFKQQSGVMLADFYTKDVILDYQPAWPVVNIADGHLMITGLGLNATSQQGKIYDSQLNDVQVAINRFEMPRLDIKGNFTGQTADLFRYLVNSPIAQEAADIYRHAKISGQASGKLDLHIPLSKKTRARFPIDYTSKVSFKDSQVDLWNSKLVFQDISGEVVAKPKNISSTGLTAKLLGQDVKMKLFSQLNSKADEIKLTMRGKLDAGIIRQHIDSPLMSKLSGITDWQGVLSLGSTDQQGQAKPGYFHFNSNLKGMASDLPPPLYKAADASKQLKVAMRFPSEDIMPVFVKFDSDWSTAIAINIDPAADKLIKRGSVIFLDATAQLPKKDELVVKGWIENLPIDQWRRLLSIENKSDASDIIGLGLPVYVDLDYLHIETEENETQPLAHDPRKTSLLNGEIRKLVYNTTNFGKVNITTRRHADGILIENLSVAAPHMNLTGNGSWFFRDDRQLTNLLFKLNSADLGALLSDLGYTAAINKGQAQSIIQAHWYDAPTRFSLATLNASIGAVVTDGVISEVKPGAGRLLGLLSLSELPRRLKLDFNEFKDGLAFSQIIGQIEIHNGVSNIDTLKIISPVALMKIEGTTNLVAKTFNQSVQVVPNVSGTVPIVSWLALGGQIGALAFILDQLFGDTFDESIGTEYEVTGSWENPVVKKVKSPQLQTESDINEQ